MATEISPDTTTDILTRTIRGRGGDIGVITLNRPKALNALNYDMFEALTFILKRWAYADNIKTVVLTAADGRAFCAGGDIKEVYGLREQTQKVYQYFHTEYALDHFIKHFPKPLIALLNGLTLGGGVGISIHSSHPIATENFRIAMPETIIGFYPDIGASYFFSRMPGYIGLYLALTGVTINAADAITLGLVKQVIGSAQIDTFIEVLANTHLNEQVDTHIFQLLEEFSIDPGHAKLTMQSELINKHFGGKRLIAILESLANDNHEWSQHTLQELQKRSPTSLLVTFEQIKRAEHMSFDECMQMEYRMTAEFVRQHDFFEGIRAQVIDKDKSPKWQPDTIAAVSKTMVERYFAPSEAGELEFIVE